MFNIPHIVITNTKGNSPKGTKGILHEFEVTQNSSDNIEMLEKEEYMFTSSGRNTGNSIIMNP